MIIIAHDRDVDGIGCHSIIHRYCALNNLPVKHLFVDYTDFCSKLGEIKDSSGETIILGDLGYSDMISGCIHDLESLGNKNEIRWFDHHDWKGVRRPKNVEMKLDMAKCGAELIADEFLPDDEVATRIASLARAQDFMGEDELAWKLYDVISSGFKKSALTELLSRGVFWSPEIEKSWSVYQTKKKDGFTFLDEHVKLYKVDQLTCLLGFSKPSLSSTIASNHLLKQDVDFAICIYPSGKLSFRRNNPTVDLRDIANLFDGGGRDTASGGNFKRQVTEENYLQVFDEIIERVNRGYPTVKGS